MKPSRLIVAVISLLIVVTAFVTGFLLGKYSAFDDVTSKVLKLRAIIRENYYGEVNEKAMKETTLNGLVSSLDPYSAYYNAEEFRKFERDIDSSYAGVGIVIDAATKTGEFIVQRVFEDSPAFAAGIKVGDKIIAVNNEDIETLPVDKVISMIRGEPDTQVNLTLSRGTNKINLQLMRKIIKVKQVVSKTYEFGGKKVGYVRIQEFARGVAKDVETELDTLMKDIPAGIVLDLRFNPGGLLEEAVLISDLFLESGTIVTTQYRSNSENRTAKPGERFEKVPLALLVNEYSASASEILSGALQDNKRAKLIGKRTYGKASIQQTFRFTEGDALKLTVGRYLTPSGKSISKGKETAGGIEPDAVVELPDSELQRLGSIWRTAPEPDAQMQKAFELLGAEAPKK